MRTDRPRSGLFPPATRGCAAPTSCAPQRAGCRLSDLDGADRFDPAIHLQPTNAWPLILLCGLLDAERIADDHEVVAVAAVSTGWFTALAASGSLGFDDAFRLVQELAVAAEEPLSDGDAPAEVIYQLTDDAWRPDEARIERFVETLAAATDAFLGVDLGAFSIVAGTDQGVDAVASALDPVGTGPRRYPLRLAGPDAWHTPLRADAIEVAADRIGSLAWSVPSVTLIDGRGFRFTPWSTDPAELARSHAARPGSDDLRRGRGHRGGAARVRARMFSSLPDQADRSALPPRSSS